MSGHTPGEWSSQGIYVVEPAGNIVARCEYSADPNLRDAKANARLISAAPELYSVLLIARQFVVVHDSPFAKDLLARIDAVTDKAEGK